MSEIIEFSPHPDKTLLKIEWLPSVSFEIPSELSGREYTSMLGLLFRDFIRQLAAHSKNLKCADSLPFRLSGEQMWVRDILIRTTPFDECALYVWDNAYYPRQPDWSGIELCHGHFNKLRVAPIYHLGMEFELFLRRKGIAHKRFGVDFLRRRVGQITV